MQSSLLVSVCMITYNHERYIRDAVEGVLMQETDFGYELVIANDCSPDNTDSVVEEYLQNHPKGNSIKYFSHKGNLGMMPNFQFAVQQCTGKYIALCEGDDYWTDSRKLQMQVDFMEANPDCSLCFHAAEIVKEGTDEPVSVRRCDIKSETGRLNARELLDTGASDVRTPAIMVRADILKALPQWYYEAPIGDIFLKFICASKGDFGYIDKPMCVYRTMVPNSFTTTKTKMGYEKVANHYHETAKFIGLFNTYSQNKFKHETSAFLKKKRNGSASIIRKRFGLLKALQFMFESRSGSNLKELYIGSKRIEAIG